MKRIVIILAMAVATLSACNIGEKGLDGDAYIKLNWSEVEPWDIDVDGLVPYDFVWDTFYYTRPGVYTINTKYARIYSSTGKTVIFPYTIDIEIFIFEGELGRTKGRDGRDANKDVFFDLELFPGGDIDFTHEIVPRTTIKSATINEKVLVKEGSEQSGKYGMKYTIYRLPEYEK